MSEEATFVNKYGEACIIHKGKNGWCKKRVPSPIIAANQAIAPLLGLKIRKLRLERGMSLKEAALFCGLMDGFPKERWWAFENATRGEGMRLGTLFQIANAFGIEMRELIPLNAEIKHLLGTDLTESDVAYLNRDLPR